MPKVRLFKMSSCNNWEDVGEGVLLLTGLCITVSQEKNNELLLTSLIQQTKYYRQSKNFIYGIGPDHFLIHFEDLGELRTTWKHLLKIQGLPDISLPFPSACNITTVLKTLGACDLDELIEQNNMKEFIKDLSEQFLGAAECDPRYFEVYKLLIASCNETILKELVTAENFNAVLKVLELDSQASGQRENNKLFLGSRFANVLSLKDEEFLELIQLNSRLGYLKDSLGPTTFDERVTATLVALQAHFIEEILTKFLNSEEAKLTLIQILNTDTPKALNFLGEIVVISRSVPIIREQLFKELGRPEFLSIFKKILKTKDCEIVKKTIEIFGEMVQVIAWNILPKLCSEEAEESVLDAFFSRAFEMDVEEAQVVSRVLRLLIDNSHNLPSTALAKIVEDLRSRLENDSQSEHNKCEILSILAYYISRNYFINKETIDSIVVLAQTSGAATKFAVNKFVRELIKQNHEKSISHLISSDLLNHTFTDLAVNLATENMKFSSALSVLLQVHQSENQSLVKYVFAAYSRAFEHTSVYPYFSRLSQKVERTWADDDYFSSAELMRPFKRPSRILTHPTKKIRIN